MISVYRSRRFAWLKSMLGYSLFILLATHAVDFYRLSQHKNPQLAPVLLQQLTVQLSEQQQLDFANGEPLLLYVWANWCGVCKTTSWAVSRIAADYPVATLALKSGDQAEVDDYLKQKNYRFPALADVTGHWMQSLHAHATPTFLIVDNTGHIRYYSVGINTELSLRAKLALY